MTTIFLDAVLKPFFLNHPWHGPTADDRTDEFPDGRLPSTHSTYGVCERKHAISNTPKGKKSHIERSGERAGHGTSPKWEMRCPGNMFRKMVTDQVSIATEVANPEEKNADHIGLPSTTHSKDVRFPWVTLYMFFSITSVGTARSAAVYYWWNCISTNTRHSSVCSASSADAYTILVIGYFDCGNEGEVGWKERCSAYGHTPHNDVSVNDVPPIWRWSYKIITLKGKKG